MKNELFQEAIDSLDMEDYLDREGITYKKAMGKSGPQLNLKECPCCGDSKWKVYIGAATGLGNCFAGDCEAKFTKWKFVAAYMPHLNNRQLIEYITDVSKSMGWRPPRKHAVAVDLESAELKLPSSFALPHGDRNLAYLANRGITGDMAKFFSLRYSPAGRFDYVDLEGYPAHQDYSKRVIIPIFDLMGDLVSFQGRDISGTAAKKYLFPPGFASTGSHLYNGQNAMNAEKIVIGEGAFDVIACKIAFDEDPDTRDLVPVGSFGKHLSSGGENSQLAKLLELKARNLKEVTFMWDGEKQALDDAVEAALLVKSIGLVARVAILPTDKDPNEVPPNVVREAYWKAVAISPASAAKLKLARTHDK